MENNFSTLNMMVGTALLMDGLVIMLVVKNQSGREGIGVGRNANLLV